MAAALEPGRAGLSGSAAHQCAAMTDAAAPALELRRVAKAFGRNVAVEDCSLSLRAGGIIALVGPSGCGKTTILNLIAGFEQADAGWVFLGGKDQARISPRHRNLGIVFQSYALFPHMSAADNIGYGLRVVGTGRAAIQARVEELAALLRITPLLARLPHELSGGQRQRVAIARALARRPGLLLLDEAMSALDRNLREEVQIELSLLLRRLGTSAVIVTHDQREAFALADQVAVMNAGRIEQIGSAETLFGAPASAFVVEFLGGVGRLQAQVEVQGATARMVVEDALRLTLAAPPGRHSGTARLYLPREAVTLEPTATEAHAQSPAEVMLVTQLGVERRHHLRLGSQEFTLDLPAHTQRPAWRAGERVFLAVDPARVHWFP